MMPTPEITTVPSARRLEFNENAIALIAFAIVLVSAVFWADKPPTMEKTDFSVTYIGSRMVYLGQGAKLYDIAEQKKLKSLLLPDAEAVLIYEHPPFEALLLAPLGALPYKTAYLVWGLINVAIWLTLPYLLRPYARAPKEDLGYLLLWLLFAPLGITLFQGQSSLALLLVYSLAFIALKRSRDFRAGAIFGLGLFKFQFALPVALIFLLRRQWRFMKGFLATAAALGVLSVIAVGFSGIWSYIHLLVSIVRHPDNIGYGAAVDMGTIQGFVHAMLGRVLGHTAISLIVAAVSALLIGWTAWQWHAIDEDRGPIFDLMFAVSIVVALVTGSHMFTHDLSPLLLAMFLVMSQKPKPVGAGMRTVLRAILVLLWIPFIYFALVAWHCMYLLFPVLMIFGTIVLRMATGSRASTGSFSQHAAS